eukprot:g13228.t1
MSNLDSVPKPHGEAFAQFSGSANHSAQQKGIANLFDREEYFDANMRNEDTDDVPSIIEAAQEYIRKIDSEPLSAIVQEANKYTTRKQYLTHAQACLHFLSGSFPIKMGEDATAAEKQKSIQYVADYCAFACWMATMAKGHGEMLLSKSPSGVDSIAFVKQSDQTLIDFCNITSELCRLYQQRVISQQEEKAWPVILMVLVSPSFAFRMPFLYSKAINYIRAKIVLSYDPEDLDSKSPIRSLARKDPRNFLINARNAMHEEMSGKKAEEMRDMSRGIEWPFHTLHEEYKHNSRHYDMLTQAFAQISNQVEVRRAESKQSNAPTIDPAAEEGEFVLPEEEINPDGGAATGSAGWLLAKGKGKRCGNAVVIAPGKGSFVVHPGTGGLLSREQGNPLSAIGVERFGGLMPPNHPAQQPAQPHVFDPSTRLERTRQFQFLDGNRTITMQIGPDGIARQVGVAQQPGASSSSSYSTGTGHLLGGVKRSMEGYPINSQSMHMPGGHTNDVCTPLPDPLAELEAIRVPFGMQKAVVTRPTPICDHDQYIDAGYSYEFERDKCPADDVPRDLWRSVAFTHQDELNARMCRVINLANINFTITLPAQVRTVMKDKMEDFKRGIHNPCTVELHPMLYALNLRSTIAVYFNYFHNGKREVIENALTVHALNGLLFQSTFDELAEQAQAGGFKPKTKDQLRRQPNYMEHDVVIKIFTKVVEQTKSNTTGEFTLFQFDTPQAFAEYKSELKSIKDEVDCYSSRLQLDPQLTDTKKCLALLKKHKLSVILKSAPFIFTPAWKGDFANMCAQYMDYHKRVDSGQMWKLFDGKSTPHGVCGFLDEMQHVEQSITVSTMCDIIIKVATKTRVATKEPKGGDKGDKGDKGDPNKKKKKGEPGKGDKGGKGGAGKGGGGGESAGFLAICDSVRTAITEQYIITAEEIKTDEKFCCPEAGRILNVKKWGGGVIKCNHKGECSRDHKHTQQAINSWKKRPEKPDSSSTGDDTSKEKAGEKNKVVWPSLPCKSSRAFSSIMPVLTRIRKSAIDHLNRVYRIERGKKYQREKARLEQLWEDIGALETSPEAVEAHRQYEELKLEHVRIVGQRYIGHDVEFDTAPLNPWLFLELSQKCAYLDPQRRKKLFGPRGFMNTGFPTAGQLDRWDAWNDGKPLTKDERLRYDRVDGGEIDANMLLQDKIKLRAGPYAFESRDVQERSYSAYMKLLDGRIGKRIEKKDLDLSRWVCPVFGIGQKEDEHGNYAKVRPINNEKLRNELTSPIAEHMTLPNVPQILEGIMYCANPGHENPYAQTKRDVTDTIIEGRKAKAKGRMSWAHFSAIPKGAPARPEGMAFIPSIAKLDLFQAYVRLSVSKPEDNQAQLWNPFDTKMEYGVMHVMTFGNTHSVFSFCAAISESVSRMLNVIFLIPTLIYVDDVIIFAEDEVLQLYTDTARRLLARLGVAVAPEKTTLCPKGSKIELLGIDFQPFDDRVEISLPEKKVGLINKKATELLFLLSDDAFPSSDLEKLYKELESFSGVVVHAFYNRRHKRGLPLTRYIYWMLKGKPIFDQKVGSSKNRQILRLMIQRIRTSIESREVWTIKRDAAAQGRLHLMTDASADGTDVAVGGILYALDGSSIGYTRHLTQRQLPPILRGHSIIVYELLAIVVAIKVMREQISGHNLVAHCDNTGAVFGIVKGQSLSRVPTAVIAALVEACNEKVPDSYIFWAYVNTDANPADATTRIKMMQTLIETHGTEFNFSDQDPKLYGIATRVPKAATQVHGPKHNYYNSGRVRLEHFEEKINVSASAKREKAATILPPKAHEKWPLNEENIFLLWPGERWHNRNDPTAIRGRNSKWRTWMHYCERFEPRLFFEPDKIQNREEAEQLEQAHPNVKWSTLQRYGEFLADCEHRNPENYASLVGGRLREVNALERGNVHATALMTQTFGRLAKMMEDRLPSKANPPDLARISSLTNREQRIFAFWSQTGLRPRSMESVRADMIHEEPFLPSFTRVMAPAIKIAPKQGETFAVWIPTDCVDKSIFPIKESELNSIARKLNTTGYGPRRAMAIYLKLLQGTLGITNKMSDGSPSPRLERYKSLVDAHTGWSAGSKMWEKEYSIDCWSYQETDFAVSGRLKEWLDCMSKATLSHG